MNCFLCLELKKKKKRGLRINYGHRAADCGWCFRLMYLSWLFRFASLATGSRWLTALFQVFARLGGRTDAFLSWPKLECLSPARAGVLDLWVATLPRHHLRTPGKHRCLHCNATVAKYYYEVAMTWFLWLGGRGHHNLRNYIKGS